MKIKIIISICIMITSLQMNAQLSYKTEQISNMTNGNIARNEQDSLKPKSKAISQKHKFYLGLIGSWDYQNIKSSSKPPPPKGILGEGTSILNKFIIAYQIGIKLQYNITEDLSIRSGLTLSVVKTNWTEHQDFPPFIVNNNFYNNSIIIPIMIGYTVYKKGHFQITPSAGFIAESNSLTRTILAANTIQTYSTQINVGLEYFIIPKILLTLEPYFRYNFNNSYDAVLSDTYHYYNLTHPFGAFVSINYKFK